eukprot:m.190090 g.190090  ORF g.190090 m.190090 type:complete len:493 (-) comp17950_c0_seq1:102-1580(-)
MIRSPRRSIPHKASTRNPSRPTSPLITSRPSSVPPGMQSPKHTNFTSSGDASQGWLLGSWRICVSAPRRATLFAALLMLGLIAVAVARTARSPTTPDTGRLASILSSSSYVHDGQVVVDKATLFSALGIRGSHASDTGKIKLYDTARGLKLVKQPVESTCQDAKATSTGLKQLLNDARPQKYMKNVQVAAGCLCGGGATIDSRQPWEVTVGAGAALGANAHLNVSKRDVWHQASAASLVEYALSAKDGTTAAHLQAAVNGLQYGVDMAGTGRFEGTEQPERGASFFAEGLARSLLLLTASGHADLLEHIARPSSLEPMVQWLGTSSSMRRQGGWPEVRMARAAALHMVAPLLTKPVGQQAVLAAHRYARRAVELQEPDGTYCFVPAGPASREGLPECQFSQKHHGRALLYATRLLAVCGWDDLRSLLHASVDLALTRLEAGLAEPPAPGSVDVQTYEGEATRTLGEALVLAGTALKRPEAAAKGGRWLAALK